MKNPIIDAILGVSDLIAARDLIVGRMKCKAHTGVDNRRENARKSPGIVRGFLFSRCVADVADGSFSTEIVKADACTCPLRPESDRQPS
jgi:hypothetical protein